MLETNFILHTPAPPQVADCTTRIVSGHSRMVPSEQITPKLTVTSTFNLCHPRIKKSDSRQEPEKQTVVNPTTIPIYQLTTFLTALSIPSPWGISPIQQQQFITSSSEEFYSSCWRTQINKLLSLLQSSERLLVELVWEFYHSLPDLVAKLGILLSPMEPTRTMS